LAAIAAYNEEDCLATLALRDWLLVRRPEAEQEHGIAIPFLEPPPVRGGPEPEEARNETEQLRERLLATAGDHDGRLLCARLLEYHRREARPGWWWYFRRLQMTDEQLAHDSEALGLLVHDGSEPLPVV